MKLPATLRARWRQSLALDPIDSGWLTLTHRRIYILPTARGGAVFAALAVCAITAMNYTANLVFALAFLLLGFFLVCLHATFFQLYGLRLRLAPPALCVLGEDATAELSITETAGRARSAVSVALALNAEPQAHDIPPQSQSTFHLDFSPHRRGRMPIGRITVASTAPAGLFRAWSYFHSPDVVWVAPAPERNAPAPLGEIQDQSLTNGTFVRPHRLPSADGIDGLRETQPGDAPRRVDWRRLARGGALATRVGESQNPPPSPSLDLRYDALLELGHEARLSRLSAWVLEATPSEKRVKLTLPDASLDWGQGAAHSQACLQALAESP